MGRGRAKAKQQKVARELKYSTHFTDLDALQRELGASSPPEHGGERRVNGASHPAGDADEADGTDDEYASASYDESDDEYDSWTGTER